MFEITRENIVIDPDLQIDDCRNPSCVLAYVEIYFDPFEKFCVAAPNEDAWINLYAIYNPCIGSLVLEYYIETDVRSEGPFVYVPTKDEALVIVEMIEAKCLEIEHLSCMELISYIEAQ